MNVFEVAMWVAIGSIVYTYAGYPGMLWALSAWRRPELGASHDADRVLPTLAVVIAAYNEERHIGDRLRNVLASDYPADRLEILIGSDGSSDRTAGIVREFSDPRIRFVDSPLRRGKPEVVNELVTLASADVLVFTDANTFFDRGTLRALAGRFDDPRVGCVCGELKLVARGAVENPDHLYWRYERWLKRHESRLDALLGANGGVYAVRRERYRPVPPDTIVDDFCISMQTVLDGYRCVYEPGAVATEEVPPRIRDEFRRRVRIGIGNYQALARLASALNPRSGYRAFAFFSHKVLRWFVPHLMLVAFAANVALAALPGYGWLLALQCAFYGLAAVGWAFSRVGTTPRALRLPLFFVGMNLALLFGFFKFVAGRYGGAWTRTER